MKDKIAKFKKEISDLKELSSNAISYNEKLADEIIDGLLAIIEDQYKANIESLVAIGDYGTMKTLDKDSYFNKEGTTRQVAYFLAGLKDRDTSVKKQLEKAFYTLQKSANKKIEEVGENLVNLKPEEKKP